ncbi:hypothetical protein EN779_35365, partial [Mesorhizobium sp. M4B.F.Ca.ET.088.02.2.1]
NRLRQAVSIFRLCRPANGGFLRFRCSRASSTLRSGSRNPPFSARPDLNLNTACNLVFFIFF